MKIRRVVSLTVLLSFTVLALSGIILFLSPQGRVAYWSRWTVLGLTKEQFGAIHTTFMVLFLVVAVWHIVYNWRPITGYLKSRSKQLRVLTPESGVAATVVGIFLVGGLTGLPPFGSLLEAGDGVKAYWEASRGGPPWGHAEQSTLVRFCRGMEDVIRLEEQRLVVIDCEEVADSMRARGYRGIGLDERLIDIAEASGTTPQRLAQLVRSVARPVTAAELVARLQPDAEDARFPRPASGLGRLTLRSYAERFGHDPDELVHILRGVGLEVDPDQRLRDEAARLGTDPAGLIEALNEADVGTTDGEGS